MWCQGVGVHCCRGSRHVTSWLGPEKGSVQLSVSNASASVSGAHTTHNNGGHTRSAQLQCWFVCCCSRALDGADTRHDATRLGPQEGPRLQAVSTASSGGRCAVLRRRLTSAGTADNPTPISPAVGVGASSTFLTFCAESAAALEIRTLSGVPRSLQHQQQQQQQQVSLCRPQQVVHQSPPLFSLMPRQHRALHPPAAPAAAGGCKAT